MAEKNKFKVSLLTTQPDPAKVAEFGSQADFRDGIDPAKQAPEQKPKTKQPALLLRLTQEKLEDIDSVFRMTKYRSRHAMVEAILNEGLARLRAELEQKR